MPSPVSRKKLKHPSMLNFASPSSTTQDHALLDCLPLDGRLLPPSHTSPITTTSSSSRKILDSSLEEDDNVDARDDDNNTPSSPLSYLTSIFTSHAYKLNTSSSPHHVIMNDQRTRSPTMALVVPDNQTADPMLLDCLSLDGGCILPPESSTSATSRNMLNTKMATTRKKKEL